MTEAELPRSQHFESSFVCPGSIISVIRCLQNILLSSLSSNLTPFAQQTRIRASPSLTELRASRSAPAADSRSRSPSVAFANIDNSGSYEALKLLAFENPSVVHSAANTKDETLRAFLAAEVDEEKEAF